MFLTSCSGPSGTPPSIGGGAGRALQLPMLKGGMPMFTKTEGGK